MSIKALFPAGSLIMCCTFALTGCEGDGELFCPPDDGTLSEQLAMTPMKQRHAELFLERLHLSAHRGLGEMQLRARAREAQIARCRLEAAQQIQARQVTLQPFDFFARAEIKRAARTNRGAHGLFTG